MNEIVVKLLVQALLGIALFCSRATAIASSHETLLANLAARTIERHTTDTELNETPPRPSLRALLSKPSGEAPVNQTSAVDGTTAGNRTSALERTTAGNRATAGHREAAHNRHERSIPFSQRPHLLLPDCRHRPRWLIAVLRQRTADEISRLIELTRPIARTAAGQFRLHLLVDHNDVLADFHPTMTKEDFSFIETSLFPAPAALWLQDFALPTVREDASPVFIDLGRRDLCALSLHLARCMQGQVIYPAGLRGGQGGNYGGNVIAAPDQNILIGSTASKTLHAFLSSYIPQKRVLTVDTDWLTVGHLDEFISLVPLPSVPCGYGIVKASPTRALDILSSQSPCSFTDDLVSSITTALDAFASYPEGFEDGDMPNLQDTIVDLGMLYHHCQKPLRTRLQYSARANTPGRALVRYNQICAGRIDRAVRTLQRTIGPVPVLPVPSLFYQHDGTATSLLPAICNLVVLGRDLIVPDPWYRPFRQSARHTLQSAGFDVHFLSSTTYHFLEGQVHCATMVIRDNVVAPTFPARY